MGKIISICCFPPCFNRKKQALWHPSHFRLMFLFVHAEMSSALSCPERSLALFHCYWLCALHEIKYLKILKIFILKTAIKLSVITFSAWLWKRHYSICRWSFHKGSVLEMHAALIHLNSLMCSSPYRPSGSLWFPFHASCMVPTEEMVVKIVVQWPLNAKCTMTEC